MGRARGQRNAAREKHWPGADAAELRTLKRDQLDLLADELLPDLPRIEQGTIIHSEVPVDLSKGAKFASAMSTPLELSSAPIVYITPKNFKGRYCSRCNRPCYGDSGEACIVKRESFCIACYRLNAQEKWARRVLERQEKAENQAEDMRAYAFWIDEFYGAKELEKPQWKPRGKTPSFDQQLLEGTVPYRVRSVPDFSIALLNEIEEAELLVGVPYAVWPSLEIYTDRFATTETKRSVTKSNSAGRKMFSFDKRIGFVRQRPRSRSKGLVR